MGFPPEFALPAAKRSTAEAITKAESSAYRQFGNAVIPPVITAIAERLLSAIGVDVTPPPPPPPTPPPSVPAAGAIEGASAEDDAAALTATVADGRLALAGWVPRRLRGRPLVLPPAAELQSATHAKLNNAQLEGIPAALFSAALRRLAHLDLSYNACLLYTSPSPRDS